MYIMIFYFRSCSKILIVKHFGKHIYINQLVVHEKVSELGVFKAEDPEKGKEILQLLVKKEVLAANVKELLNRQ
jgi:hypothetical protein